ncbi:BMP family ABC transporter substrate-binding protein [Granulosicoccus sp. 3-233]|uniref:BMP family ABC transporter substrate-binding protein n=1 Tax=Granulosicoccus sp. 3-233 TaxID=3417969 RepID=UPI003D359AC1
MSISAYLKRAGLVFGAAVLSAAALSAQAADPFKVGFVYVGPVGDHGWTYRHDVGRQAIQDEFGNDVETTFVESVPEGADAERVIRKLASSGHDLIFTTSFGFMNPTVKVARDFPGVKFEHATGYKRADNVSTYGARFYEGRAVIGTIAGMMTKTNTVGYIGSFPIPEVVRGINAFTIAMRKVNPDAEVKVVWVNSWYDPGKEADAAKALIDQGADIITQHTDSPAPLQVAEERGVLGFGQASDMSAFAPKSQLTSIIDNWDSYYVDRTRAAMEGSWESSDTWGGIASGMVAFPEYSADVPDDVKAAAEVVREGIIDGSFHPFQGPIMDQSGKEVLPEGEVYDDKTLLGMNFYVQGVQGDLPQ